MILDLLNDMFSCIDYMKSNVRMILRIRWDVEGSSHDVFSCIVIFSGRNEKKHGSINRIVSH
jgi:hypothetical protein